MKYILLSLFLLSGSLANAGWKVYFIPESTHSGVIYAEKVTMTYSDDLAQGFEKFSEGLESIHKKGKLDKLGFIRPGSLTDDQVFQNEMIAAFKDLAPNEWREAEKSSGNMHNPKMFPLKKYLSAAFLRTTLAKGLARNLEQYGLRISEFGQEKLQYEKEGGQRVIRGIFHIGIVPKQSLGDRFRRTGVGGI